MRRWASSPSPPCWCWRRRWCGACCPPCTGVTTPTNAGAGLHDAWFLGGFAALGTALFVLLQRGFRRAVGHAAAALGPVAAATVLLLVLSWRLPEASYVLAWPLIGTLLAYGLLYVPQIAGKSGNRVNIQVSARAGAGRGRPARLADHRPGAEGRVRHHFSRAQRAAHDRAGPAAGDGQRAADGPAPLHRARPGRSPRWPASRRPAPRRRMAASPLPQPNRMVYLKDAATWKAYWMMPDGPLDAWARRFFPNATRARVQVDAFGWNSRPMWLARGAPHGGRLSRHRQHQRRRRRQAAPRALSPARQARRAVHGSRRDGLATPFTAA